MGKLSTMIVSWRDLLNNRKLCEMERTLMYQFLFVDSCEHYYVITTS